MRYLTNLKTRFKVFVISRMDRFLRRRGYIVIPRFQVAAAAAYMDNVADRTRKLGGGKASRYTIGEQNKKIRQLAEKTARYLKKLDQPAEVV